MSQFDSPDIFHRFTGTPPLDGKPGLESTARTQGTTVVTLRKIQERWPFLALTIIAAVAASGVYLVRDQTAAFIRQPRVFKSYPPLSSAELERKVNDVPLLVSKIEMAVGGRITIERMQQTDAGAFCVTFSTGRAVFYNDVLRVSTVPRDSAAWPAFVGAWNDYCAAQPRTDVVCDKNRNCQRDTLPWWRLSDQ